MTMPGLPGKVPAAEKIDVDSDGRITDCFSRSCDLGFRFNFVL